MPRPVLALAGGVGGARFAWGLARALAPEDLTVVVNTGDDEEFFGLHVSPDLDTVMYTLAGLEDPVQGWGLAGDTYNALGRLRTYGGPHWFLLGDRDLATHIKRTELLRSGASLSQATTLLCQALGVRHRVVPMTDQRVRTVVVTDEGPLPFQEYFVKRRCEPRVRSVRFEGAAEAAMSPGFREALASAQALVFCPSNPFLSIDPILALPGVREAIGGFRGPRAAVSPIVGGRAIKGPAAKMMAELGMEASALAVARRYVGLCDLFVIDEADEDLAPEIEALGMRALVTDTIMDSRSKREALARRVLESLERVGR